jgi:hypothetical protein
MKIEDLDASHSRWRTRTVMVDNGVFRLDLFPDFGAKIYSLVHQPTGKELLWRNPFLPAWSARTRVFDDCWTGGWDESFPNDEVATIDGVTYPDHGELWAASWTCEVDPAGTIYLRNECPISGCRVEKWISLEDDEERIRFRHRLTNLRDQAIPYLWKLHPALVVSPGDFILIPARRILLEPEFLGTLASAPLESSSPVLELPDRTVDLRIVPPRANKDVYLYYGVDQPEGWCSCYDPSRRLAVALSYPRDLFTSCWLFASYGGWRDHYVAVLEPSTAYPFRLDKAAAAGQCSTLAANAQQEATVVFATGHNIDGVTHVSEDGLIH